MLYRGSVVPLAMFKCFLRSPDLLDFLHHALSTVSLNCLSERMQSHIGCIYLSFLHCGFSNEPSGRLPNRCIVTLVAFVWLLSTMHLQMCLQIAGLNGCKVTLVAFVWFFSAVCFQMCPQIACQRGCVITLVAFVWLFSTMCLQMCPQIACPRGCKIALVAFVQFFPVLIKNSLTEILLQGIIMLKILFHYNQEAGCVPCCS